MQINRIGYQPNFQAKFVKNTTLMEAVKDEINDGHDEELSKSLNDLTKHHKNIALVLSKEESLYVVTNMYNGNKIGFYEFNDETIDKLNDIKSNAYKRLFVGDKKITPAKTERIAENIAGKYFVKSAPDYTYGHMVDASY